MEHSSNSRRPLDPKSLATLVSFDGMGRVGLVVGLVGTVLLVLGAVTNQEQFMRSYLMGYLLWLAVALGSLALLAIQHLSGGQWGLVARRVFEASARTLPVLAILFVPLLFGLHDLYEWTHTQVVAQDQLLQHKAPYLNESGWMIRSVIYFLVWIVTALFLSRWSGQQDSSDNPKLIPNMRKVSAIGLISLIIAGTFASFDWLMSLQPHWYSTIYGVWFVDVCGLAGLSFTILIMLNLSRRAPMDAIVEKRHFHDWGKLLLAFTMLWAYFSLSQFLIIWSANLPEEVVWYLQRLEGGWQWVALALVFFHFFFPFALLLSRDLKRDSKRLAFIAGLMIVMCWLDLFWQVVPAFHGNEHLTIHWLDLVAPIAVGGLWLWRFSVEVKKRPIVPLNDPYFQEVFVDVEAA